MRKVFAALFILLASGCVPYHLVQSPDLMGKSRAIDSVTIVSDIVALYYGSPTYLSLDSSSIVTKNALECDNRRAQGRWIRNQIILSSIRRALHYRERTPCCPQKGYNDPTKDISF